MPVKALICTASKQELRLRLRLQHMRRGKSILAGDCGDCDWSKDVGSQLKHETMKLERQIRGWYVLN